MNKQQLMQIRNKALSYVRPSNRPRGSRNTVRGSKNETEAHYIGKARVCYQLLREGKEFITEAIFINGSRCDILSLDDFLIIEICATETKKACVKKLEKYPSCFYKKIISVKNKPEV